MYYLGVPNYHAIHGDCNLKLYQVRSITTIPEPVNLLGKCPLSLLKMLRNTKRRKFWTFPPAQV